MTVILFVFVYKFILCGRSLSVACIELPEGRVEAERRGSPPLLLLAVCWWLTRVKNVEMHGRTLYSTVIKHR